MAITLDGTNGILSPDFEPSGSTTPTNGLFLPTTNALGFATNSTERLRLDANGQLMVGATSASGIIYGLGTSSNGYATISDGTGSILIGGSNAVTGGGVTGANAAIRTSGNLIFCSGGASERARIDSSGNLLVGTTNTDPAGNNVTGAAIRSGAACSIQNGSTTALALGSSANNTYLQVFRNAGTLAGYISVPTASTTTYNSVSDQRLKENIVDAPSALSSINAVKVRSFDWKSDGLHVDYGWIAQELLEVAPEAVSASDDPDQMMGVDFGRLTPRLVKAIQELTARLEALEAKA